jgi:hypothetical protein
LNDGSRPAVDQEIIAENHAASVKTDPQDATSRLYCKSSVGYTKILTGIMDRRLPTRLYIANDFVRFLIAPPEEVQ